MWTYHSEALQSKAGKPEMGNSSWHIENKPVQTPKQPKQKSRHSFHFNYFTLLYLLGATAGSTVFLLPKSHFSAYTDFFADKVITLYTAENTLKLFFYLYIPYLLQLSVIFFAGLCTFGGIILPLLILSRGFGFGCLAASFALCLGMKEYGVPYILILWAPEAMFFCAFILLSCLALRSSLRLQQLSVKSLSAKRKPRHFAAVYFLMLLYSLLPVSISLLGCKLIIH